MKSESEYQLYRLVDEARERGDRLIEISIYFQCGHKRKKQLLISGWKQSIAHHKNGRCEDCFLSGKSIKHA
jgi:hypothetical protein